MGVLSRLIQCLAAKGNEFSFQIPWYSEVREESCELTQPLVFMSDVEGITASDIAPILERCKNLRRSLLLFTPGVDQSVIRLLGHGDVAAVRATDLPDQPFRALLEDVAIVTGGCAMFKELGFGLSFPGFLDEITEHGIVIPLVSFKEVELTELGTAERASIYGLGTVFAATHGFGTILEWRNFGGRQACEVRGRAEQLLREEPTPGRDERLRRLGVAPTRLGAAPRPAALRHLADRMEAAFALASPYFITDINNRACVLEDFHVALFSEPLTDLQLLVNLFGYACASGRPILIFAPSVSDEAMAICVVNKLRGTVLCAVVVPQSQSQDVERMLADLARRTGARVITPSDAHLLGADELSSFLGRARKLCATSEGMALHESNR